jgi:pullulanase
MGDTIDHSPQANQTNISKIPATGIGSVAVFNDAIRDGLKGSVFEKTGKGYISGDFAPNVAKVQFGIMGGVGPGVGWQVKDAMVINYMSAHDNHTLWDKLAISNPDNTVAERVAMNRLGAAIIMISRGTPFMQAGEEMLRTKGGDENSYKSSDAVNNIDWSVLNEGSREYKTMRYYKGLIEMRKHFDIFTNPKTQILHTEELGSGLLAVTFDDGNGGQALVLINPHNTGLPYSLDGSWNLVANGETAGSTVIATETGSVTVEAIGIRVYVNDKLAQ